MAEVWLERSKIAKRTMRNAVVGEQVIRWDALVRVEFLIYLVAFAMLAVVELAFLFRDPVIPGLPGGLMLSEILGAQLIEVMHIAGIALLGGIFIFHIIYHSLFLRRTRFSELIPTGKDVSDAAALIRYYFGGGGEWPKLGFHGPLMKFAYWIGAIGIVIYLYGAMNLWLPTVFPGYVVAQSTKLMSFNLTSFGFALIAFVTVLYLLYLFLVAPMMREVHPEFNALFFDGKVPLEWVKKYHPLWYEEIVK